MGKENYQAPTLDELIVNGLATPYTGKNKSRIHLKNMNVDFHSTIALLREQKKFTDDTLRDLAVAIRLLALEEINQAHKTNYYVMSFGSDLAGTLENHLHIKNKHDISARQRYIYLIKLLSFFEENPQYSNPIVNKLLLKNLAKVYDEVESEADRLFKALPTEMGIDANLEILFELYLKEKKPGTKPNKWREFLAQLGEAIKFIAASSPELEEESEKFGFNRTWRLKVGALIFFMEVIKTEWVLDSALYRVCSKILKKLNDIPDDVKHDCLATYKSFINDYNTRKQIEAFGRLKYPNSQELASIDGSLERYDGLLNKKLNSYSSSGNSNFPNMTLALGLIGAVALYTAGAGAGAAVGTAMVQTDNFVPVLTKASHYTSKVMTLALGEPGKNHMSYKASELVATHTLSGVLGHICGGAAAVAGFFAGAVPGAAIDFSKDCYDNMRSKMALNPSYIKQDDLEFVVALLKTPASIISAKNKERLQYNTAGMFAPKVETNVMVPKPETSATLKL